MACLLRILAVGMLVAAANAQNVTTPPAAVVETTTAAAVETTTAAAAETTTAPPVETTAAVARATTAAPDMGGLSVVCTQEYMEAILDITKQSSINLDGISLEDSDCKLVASNRTHVTFKTDLDKCGTKHNTTDKYIVYYNAILANTNSSSKDSNPIISRDFQATFPFQCSFPRRRVLSVTSFSPRRKVVYTRATEFGNFTFLMDMYKTDSYEEIVNGYPHVVNLNQPMYFQVKAESNDSKLVLFIKNARATPSDDFNDQTFFEFIENGCSKDSGLDYTYNSKSATQQFSITAFRFINSNSENIFIHAEVEVCRSGDVNSVCAKGCQNNKRRRRAVDDAPSAMMFVGPLKVSQASSAGSAAGASVGTVGIIAASLGALVLVLIVALAVVFRRRGAAQSPKVVFTKVKGEENNRLV